MNEWMLKLTSQIVLVQVSSIIFEDLLIDVGAWREVSVQVLVGNNNVFLSGNETFCFYSERSREDLHALSQTRRRKIHPVNFMFLLGFAIPNSVMSLFSTINRNIVVHWQEEGIWSFLRSFRERNQSLRDHRWEPFSGQHHSFEKKKSCSWPKGIL